MTFERTSVRAIDTENPDTTDHPDTTTVHADVSPTGRAIFGSHLSRRRVLHGAAGLGVLGIAGPALAGCGGDDPAEVTPSAGSVALPAAADVPVGGGVVVEGDEPVVVTQPTEGNFKAFSAVCTHQGCTVGEVTDNVIACPCHGSKFNAETGEVVEGPAEEALASVEIVVDGDQITLA